MSTVFEGAGKQTKGMVTAALFTAFVAVMAQISIPLPIGVPITMQTFAIALCGYVLGWRWGFASIAVYILLGAAGVPVFSSFSGGVGILTGMTGGYIFGFLALAALCGLGMKFRSTVIRLLWGLSGLLLCHVIGVIQFSVVSGNSLLHAAMVASVPFLIKDVISLILAYLFGLQLIRLLKKIAH